MTQPLSLSQLINLLRFEEELFINDVCQKVTTTFPTLQKITAIHLQQVLSSDYHITACYNIASVYQKVYRGGGSTYAGYCHDNPSQCFSGAVSATCQTGGKRKQSRKRVYRGGGYNYTGYCHDNPSQCVGAAISATCQTGGASGSILQGLLNQDYPAKLQIKIEQIRRLVKTISKTKWDRESLQLIQRAVMFHLQRMVRVLSGLESMTPLGVVSSLTMVRKVDHSHDDRAKSKLNQLLTATK